MLLQSILTLLPLAIAAPSVSLPRVTSLDDRQFQDFGSFPPGCSTNGLLPPLSAGLSLSANEQTSLVTVGRGVQNYTCHDGKFVSAGALANLYDVSCVFHAAKSFATPDSISEMVTSIAYKGLHFPDTSGLPVAVDHFFLNTPGSKTGGISPVFATQADRVLLAKDAGVDAPDPTKNVQWLKLIGVADQGGLSKTVYRLHTFAGQPPTSCGAEGEQTSVGYAAMYWFTK